MKRFFYVVISVVFTAVFITTGCSGGSNTSAEAATDSIVTDSVESDTLETLLEESPVPKAADGLFDDFFFNFAANKTLQFSRIVFPLPCNVFGTEKKIDRKSWKMEHFFMRQGFYTLVAGSYDALEKSKDRSITEATVEKVVLSDHSVKRYFFRKEDGLWHMNSVSQERLESNANGEFYFFYGRFVSDSLFRQESLAESVAFSGPDPDDDFSRIEGNIMPEQFGMFVPEIPQGTIYNVVYGSQEPLGDQRVLVVRGVSNGFEIEMVFHRRHGRFVLTALNT